jgi:hypothetical protein
MLALAGLLVAIALIALFLASGGGGRSPRHASTRYSFASAAEVRLAQARLDAAILDAERSSRRLHRPGDSTAISSTQCSVKPPSPAALRMVCLVLASSREARSATAPHRTDRWRAIVRVNSHTGALSWRARGPDGERVVSSSHA